MRKVERILVRVIGRFEEDNFYGYLTKNNNLIWYFGGIRSLTYIGFGPERIEMGQPLASVDRVPLIKRYEKEHYALVEIRGNSIKNITVDDADIIWGLLW